MDYLLLIHNNSESTPIESEWADFIDEAIVSGLFQGGSQLGESSLIGKQEVPLSTDHIGGFMRFKSKDLNALRSLLNSHPVVKNGGSIELIEMPKTS